MESDGSDICSPSTGMDNAPSPSTTTAITTAGNRRTNRTQLRPIDEAARFLAGLRPGPGLPATPGIFTAKDLSPHAPSRAGISVSAMSTDTATVTAAATPIQVRNSICASASAMSAVNTVSPANTTEDPAVPVARPAASGPARWARSCR